MLEPILSCLNEDDCQRGSQEGRDAIAEAAREYCRLTENHPQSGPACIGYEDDCLGYYAPSPNDGCFELTADSVGHARRLCVEYDPRTRLYRTRGFVGASVIGSEWKPLPFDLAESVKWLLEG